MNTDKPILNLVDDFLAGQDIRENSKKKYKDNLTVFITWLTKNGDVHNPQREDILRYKGDLMRIGRTPSTIDIYLAPVRQFFEYLQNEGIHNGIGRVRSPKKEGFSKGYLQPFQVTELLQSFNRNTIQGLREYAIVNLMVRTGMRCIEVSRSDVRDIKKENGAWVIYIQGKGRDAKDRILGITDKIVNPIIEYIETAELSNESPLFLNHSYVSNKTRITTLTISKIVKKHLRIIGLDSKKLTAHSLRHTAAITALKNGADILEVKSMLGHKRVETTMIYQRAIEEERGREGMGPRRLDDIF